MAQTRKRRRTKHRGNAAGMVEARGRTGRRPSEKEKGGGIAQDAAARRANRLANPPTWRSAFNRSLIATALFVVLLIVLAGQEPAAAIVFAIAVLPLYVAATFYTDRYFHRRHIRKHGTPQ